MKQYKCAFNHCAHPERKVNQDEAIKIGNRYWHKDCYETSELVIQIKDMYIENINSSEVVSFLMKVINDIVYGKKLENKNIEKAKSNLEAAKYLEFAVDYAIRHNIPITHVPGLYYLINNNKVREAYKKERELIVQREMKQSMNTKVEAKPVDINKEDTYSFPGNNVGFGSILKGGNS